MSSRLSFSTIASVVVGRKAGRRHKLSPDIDWLSAHMQRREGARPDADAHTWGKGERGKEEDLYLFADMLGTHTRGTPIRN